jgi:hypothetical protein
MARKNQNLDPAATLADLQATLETTRDFLYDVADRERKSVTQEIARSATALGNRCDRQAEAVKRVTSPRRTRRAAG